jgi:hypothetical protein
MIDVYLFGGIMHRKEMKISVDTIPSSLHKYGISLSKFIQDPSPIGAKHLIYDFFNSVSISMDIRSIH